MLDKIIKELEEELNECKQLFDEYRDEGYYHEMKAYDKSIEIVKKYDKDEWISVNDRLPTKSKSYQVTKVCLDEDIDEVCSEIFWTKDNKWDGERDEYCEWIVVAWMELPQPYKGDKL